MSRKNITTVLALAVVFAAVAGGFYYKGWFRDDGGGHSRLEHKVQQWTCSMHPFIVKDKPGTCPICAMELIKKTDETPAAATPQSPEQKAQGEMLGHVSLSANQRIMANVATVEARKENLNREINAVGIVQFDQSRQARVTAWIAGRIERLHVNTVGAVVSKDKPVAEIYSPDLLTTQQEYLLAVRSRDQLKSSPIPAIAQNGEGLVASARQRLMLFGVKENQIAELEKAGKPNIRLPIYTPLSGVVIEKMVQQGQYVNTGDPLFNIADLSTVWVEVEVYENEFQHIRIGQRVDIRSQSFPGRPFSGRISFIYPFLDPKTRTVKARVEMANSGMKLKPDMFVNATIKIPLGAGIVVPVTAVLDSGKRQVAWVEASPGMFEPREVQIGQRTDDKLQILSGLKAGDKVAVSGSYLIDSESQLKGGAGVDHSQHTGGAKPEAKGQTSAPPTAGKPQNEHEGHGSAPAKPSEASPSVPAKKSLKMDDMKM